MYLEYFGFREKPFNVTPDPRFFYTTPVYQEAYAGLLYGIRERKGFLVLTGEVGTGKTTLLRKLMSSLEETVHFAFFYNTTLSFDELLHAICEDFGLAVDEQDGRLSHIQALNTFLLERLAEGGTGVMFIDEAQNLEEKVLENLRLLSNLETASEKLLQIVLVGQPELEQKLSLPKLRQLKQRVAIQCKLDCLKEREVGPFIAHRLQMVGYEGPELFPTETIRRIAVYSHGIPRLINILCDNALLVAYSLSQPQVSTQMIEEVARDLQLRGVSRTEASRWAASLRAPGEDLWKREENLALHTPGPALHTVTEASRHWEDRPATTPPVRASDREVSREWGEAPPNLAVWPLTQQPRSFLRMGIGMLVVFLLLGSAVAAVYPQQVSEKFSHLVFAMDGIVGLVSERFTALKKEEPTARPSQDPMQDEIRGSSQAVPEEQIVSAVPHSVEEQKKGEQQEGERLATLESGPPQHVAAKKEPIPNPHSDWKGQHVVVTRGTTLSALVLETYGNYNILAIDLIKELNPQIKDINRIVEGEKIWLPPLTRETLLREQPNGSYHLILGSFRSPSEAERLAQKARRQGYTVVVVPQYAADTLAFHRVEVEELRDPAAIERAWSLANINNALSAPVSSVSRTDSIVR
jgi:type II secretory pathway predicted ATPase ExeA